MTVNTLVGGSPCPALSDNDAMLLRGSVGHKNKSRAGQSRFSLMVIRGTEQKRTLRRFLNRSRAK
jgi:hypothetical protein